MLQTARQNSMISQRRLYFRCHPDRPIILDLLLIPDVRPAAAQSRLPSAHAILARKFCRKQSTLNIRAGIGSREDAIGLPEELQ